MNRVWLLAIAGIFTFNVFAEQSSVIQTPTPPPKPKSASAVSEKICGEINYAHFKRVCLSSVKNSRRNYVLLKSEGNSPFPILVSAYSANGVEVQYYGNTVSSDATGTLVEMTYEFTFNVEKKTGNLMVTYLDADGNKKGNEYAITRLERVVPPPVQR